MRRTKKLTIKEYHPLKKAISVQKFIQQMVNKEAETMYQLDTNEIPNNLTYPSADIPRSVGLWNFIRQLKP